jgi:hypothetical protein
MYVCSPDIYYYHHGVCKSGDDSAGSDKNQTPGGCMRLVHDLMTLLLIEQTSNTVFGAYIFPTLQGWWAWVENSKKAVFSLERASAVIVVSYNNIERIEPDPKIVSSFR